MTYEKHTNCRVRPVYTVFGLRALSTFAIPRASQIVAARPHKFGVNLSSVQPGLMWLHNPSSIIRQSRPLIKSFCMNIYLCPSLVMLNL